MKADSPPIQKAAQKADKPPAALPSDTEALGILGPVGRHEITDRQHRMLIIAISVGILIVLFLGMIALGNMGLAASSGFAGILVACAVSIVAVVIGRNLYKINRLGKIESILAETFHAAFNPQAIVDADGRAVLANRAYERWMGKPGAHVENAIAGKLGENAMIAGEFNKLRKAARTGKAGHAELPIIKGGKIIEWRRMIVRPLPIAGYVVWRFEDISERKRAEQAVREEQAKLIDFMAHAPVGIFSVDQQGRFRFVNRTLAEWLGCTIEELTGGSLKLHDVLAKKTRDLAPYAITGGPEGHLHGDTFMRTKDGRAFPVSITQTVVMSEDGQSLRTRSIVRDLTPEQTWQQALSLSEQRFERLFAEAPIGVLILTPSLDIEECNDAALKIIRQARLEVLKRCFTDFVPEEQRQDVQKALASVLSGEDMVKPFELRNFGEAGSVMFIYAKRFNLPVTSGPHNQDGLVLYFIDYTEQKRIEAQLAHSGKLQAIGQLAGGVAHDFNNLLTAMIGFCDLLLQRHKPGDQSFADIMQIKQNGNRAANLVRQLLAFSRQQTLQPKVLSPTDVLAELANLLRRLIGANVELKMVHSRDVGLIKADQGQLEQVIINLVVNARDAMPQGGVVTISTSFHHQDRAVTRGQDLMTPGDYVKLEVSDQGIGIPHDNLQRIFEPFFSTKEVGSGTGLGLSTVYGIVRQTGGYIEVDSAVNKGSTFTVYLPHYIETAKARTEAITEEKKESKSSDLTGAGTILLVEDEDAVRVFGARALRNKGYNVLEARGGEEALKILEEQSGKIDLLVSDVVMPHMDGPTLVREIKARLPDLKVIFISGYTEDRFREQLKEGEVVHFLSKPFSLKQLAGKVKEVLTGEVEE